MLTDLIGFWCDTNLSSLEQREKIKGTQGLSALRLLETTWQSTTPTAGVTWRGFRGAGDEDQAGAKWDRRSNPL